MIINKKSITDLSGFYIVYKGSVLNETQKTYGSSHLLEHLMCKQFKHLYNDFDRYSILWNAHTSGTEVVFHMKGLEEYIHKYRHELLNSLLTFDVTEEEFNIEKQVVIQEYKDTFQDQFTSSYYNLIRKVYNNYGPIGKLESLENITYDEIKEFWKKHFSKPSVIVNVSKNSEFEGYDDFNTTCPLKYISENDDVLVYEKAMDFNKVSVTGYLEVSDDMANIDFVLDMLGKSLESPFMKEIREKRGLTYGVHNFVAGVSDTQALIMTSLITTDDKVDEIFDVYKMILNNPDKYLTKERFEIIRDYYTVKRKMDKINAHNKYKKYYTPDVWLIDSIIDNITFEKTKEIFDKYLKYDKWTWITDKTAF